MPKNHHPPIVLTIAGSDSSAGAGIQADLKTFHSYQTYGLTAITGVVAESPNQVKSWEAVSPTLLEDQLTCLLGTYPIAAVKTGALFTTELVETVSRLLSTHRLPLVIDPVGTASTGTNMGGNRLLKSLQEHLFPLSTLVTPNIPEAQALSGLESTSHEELAYTLSQKFNTNFLVKGGHAQLSNDACDFLVQVNGEVTKFTLPRIDAPDYHGTGCTLSAAITAEIALGNPLKSAITGAKSFLHTAIQTGHQWQNVEALNTFPNSELLSNSEHV